MIKSIIAWDLSDLYKGVDDPRIKDDMKIIERSAQDFRKEVKGKVSSESLTASQLANYFKFYEEIAEANFYLSLFSSLTYSTTSLDDAVNMLMQGKRAS